MTIIKSRIAAALLVALAFFSVSRSLLKDWRAAGIYMPGGDEPRNLITARSIFAYHTVEVSRSVHAENATREFYKPGFPDGNTGMHPTPNGMFSPHGLALPAYLSLPLGFLGREGARYAMAVVPAIIAGAAAWLAMIYSGSALISIASAVAATIAMPFIPASGQLYPDLPGGAVCLIALTRTISRRERRMTSLDVLIFFAIATLPWWHLRFVAVAIVLCFGTVLLRSKNKRAWFVSFAPLTLSLLLLATYNKYAFNNFAGIYGGGAIEISATAAMTLVGLFIDQNQGLLVQNPVFLIGLFYLTAFIRSDWKLGAILVVTVSALIVPNAMHVNWYGGAVISGRFQWSAAAVLVVPTIFGLAALARSSRLAFALIVVGGMALQAWYFTRYSSNTITLYNRQSDTSLADYSIFFSGFETYFPALYNVAWAYTFPANYVYFLAVLLVSLLGFIRFSEHTSCMSERSSSRS